MRRTKYTVGPAYRLPDEQSGFRQIIERGQQAAHGRGVLEFDPPILQIAGIAAGYEMNSFRLQPLGEIGEDRGGLENGRCRDGLDRALSPASRHNDADAVSGLNQTFGELARHAAESSVDAPIEVLARQNANMQVLLHVQRSLVHTRMEDAA